jgi:hypothetical protein
MIRLIRMNHHFADDRVKSNISALGKDAKDNGWKHYYEDVPVAEEFKNYLEAISKTMPRLKFAPYEHSSVNATVFDDAGVYQTTKNFRVAKSFLLYMDEYPFEMGRVSYGDHSVNNNGEMTYAVHSRRIQNAKYATHRDQHYMIMASDMKKAVKNVSKYVVRYTTKELARALFDPFYNNVNNALSKAQSKVSDAIKTVKYNDSALVTELQHLIRSNVQFATPEFTQLAKDLPKLTEELVEQKNRKPDGVFVSFRKVGDDTYAEMCVAQNARQSYQPKFTEEVIECKVDDLPPEISGNIAVLNILQNDSYVDGVGAKIDDTHFWLERG